jgi:hypothetical protein
MAQKIKESGFKQAVSRAIYDFIDYGNAFGEVTHKTAVHTNKDGQSFGTYSGPLLNKISPYDIVFDIGVSSFEAAGKITRQVVSIGTLIEEHKQNPEGFAWVPDAINETVATRHTLGAYGDSDLDKSEGL